MENLLLMWRVTESLQNPHPMHYAASKGDVEVIRSLIARGYLVNCVNFELATPLHEAATKGHLRAVQFLLDEGAWINSTNIDGTTPLSDACAAGHTDCAKLLLQRDAAVNPPMPLTSPLHEAVMRGHIQCVQLLINYGAKLNVSDCHYGTPLHAACAAYKINIECVTSLIQAGADVNATMIHKAPLHIAARRKSLTLIHLLLNYGANVYVRDSAGKRPSDLAKSNPAIHQLLLRYETHPRSLSDCCRTTILQYFVVGKDIHRFKLMGLPNKLVQYTLNNH